MAVQIALTSNTFSASEIHIGLKEELKQQEDVSLILIQESDQDMALDPTTVAAIITGGAAVLNALITSLFTLWMKKHDNETAQKKVIVKVRINKEGTDLEFPVGMSSEEQIKLLEKVGNLQEVRHIALIEK